MLENLTLTNLKISSINFLQRSVFINWCFLYAACSDCIVKLDMEGNIKQRYDGMDNWTYTVAINNRNEINSSSCWTHKVTVMENSGNKNLFIFS